MRAWPFATTRACRAPRVVALTRSRTDDVAGRALVLFAGEREHRGEFAPDGFFYVVSHWTHRVLRFDNASGAYVDEYVTDGSGGLDEPNNFVFYPGELVTVF